MDADLLFRGALVFDGDGPPRIADVAVTDDHITAVGPDLPVESAGETVDATGLMLCPGFIDMHAHSALRAFQEPHLTAKVAQGFTTELICPDGLGPAPVRPECRTERARYLAALEGHGPAEWEWETLAEYLDALAGVGPATALVPCVAHSAVRDYVLGSSRRRPDHRELATMRRVVEEGIEAGARAVSFGMIYAPGLYADTDELRVLAEPAARHGVPLVPHVRNESRGVLEAIGEFVRVARDTGAPLHVSHVKLVGCPDLLEDLLDLLTKAAEQIDLTFDHYPYGAGSTLLSALLPPWVFDGGPDAILGRLSSASERARMSRDMRHGLAGWENIYGACGPDRITVTEAAAPRRDAIGKTLAELADEQDGDPVRVVFDLLVDTGLDAAMVDHYSTEDVVQAIFRHPLGLVGSDGIFNTHPHPRLYGTAARVLGRYAIRDQLVTVEEAVARLTSRAADRLGLADRGRIRAGLRADLVLLDPEEYVDLAGYANPTVPPPGVCRVLVAGKAVYPLPGIGRTT